MANGTSDEDLFAYSIAPREHWALTDCIAIISATHKKTGSTEGHTLAGTSPLQSAAWLMRRVELKFVAARLLERDFASFASIVELDLDMMHAVMMTSNPALHYWLPASVAVMQAVREWRENGAVRLLYGGCRGERPCPLSGKRSGRSYDASSKDFRRQGCVDRGCRRSGKNYRRIKPRGKRGNRSFIHALSFPNPNRI